MNKNRYFYPVSLSSTPKKYPVPLFSDKNQLEKELNRLGLKISIGGALKGGTVSQVYSGRLDHKKVVIKHVDNLIPFDPTEFFIDKNGLKTDVQVLKKLDKSKNIRVPKVIKVFFEINTIILEDLNESGFYLLNDKIILRELDVNSALTIGESLANLALESREWEKFITNESVEQSIYERGLELRLAYPNTQTEYLFLEKEFVSNNQYFCWPDGHPKNILINKKGECAFIDFGRSHWGDQHYMLPNFLAHIVIYYLAGYIEKELTRDYLLQCINTFKKIEPVDENIFCQYLAMEVLHRANGKWITGIETKEQKLALLKFGYTVFDEKIGSVDKLLKLLS
ncbi:hypothetical protein HZA76_02200 [Candidatus Roizmanbacteria bacterium]|nr:hypothetical protein [Candidatus Roizmanbacteria bacterium]